MFDFGNGEYYISLDELISTLEKAKEHCVDGRSKVLIRKGHTRPKCVSDVEFDSNNVTITYE